LAILHEVDFHYDVIAVFVGDGLRQFLVAPLTNLIVCADAGGLVVAVGMFWTLGFTLTAQHLLLRVLDDPVDHVVCILTVAVDVRMVGVQLGVDQTGWRAEFHGHVPDHFPDGGGVGGRDQFVEGLVAVQGGFDVIRYLEWGRVELLELTVKHDLTAILNHKGVHEFLGDCGRATRTEYFLDRVCGLVVSCALDLRTLIGFRALQRLAVVDSVAGGGVAHQTRVQRVVSQTVEGVHIQVERLVGAEERLTVEQHAGHSIPVVLGRTHDGILVIEGGGVQGAVYFGLYLELAHWYLGALE